LSRTTSSTCPSASSEARPNQDVRHSPQQALQAVLPPAATTRTRSERRTLRDYYIILRERVWISLPIAAVVALGFFYMQARKTPIYEAVATLQFEKPETVVTSQGVTDPSVRSDMDLNTYIHDINSNKVRSDVVQSFTPAERAILARAAMKRLPPGSDAPADRGAPRLGRRRAPQEQLPHIDHRAQRGPRGRGARRQPVRREVHGLPLRERRRERTRTPSST
jgi:hypothetical protein